MNTIKVGDVFKNSKNTYGVVVELECIETIVYRIHLRTLITMTTSLASPYSRCSAFPVDFLEHWHPVTDPTDVHAKLLKMIQL